MPPSRRAHAAAFCTALPYSRWVHKRIDGDGTDGHRRPSEPKNGASLRSFSEEGRSGTRADRVAPPEPIFAVACARARPEAARQPFVRAVGGDGCVLSITVLAEYISGSQARSQYRPSKQPTFRNPGYARRRCRVLPCAPFPPRVQGRRCEKCHA